MQINIFFKNNTGFQDQLLLRIFEVIMDRGIAVLLVKLFIFTVDLGKIIQPFSNDDKQQKQSECSWVCVDLRVGSCRGVWSEQVGQAGVCWRLLQAPSAWCRRSATSTNIEKQRNCKRLVKKMKKTVAAWYNCSWDINSAELPESFGDEPRPGCQQCSEQTFLSCSASTRGSFYRHPPWTHAQNPRVTKTVK